MKIEFSEKPGKRGQVPRDEPVGDIEDEKGDQKGLRALAYQDDHRLIEQPAIDLVERGFDRYNAEPLLVAAECMEQREFGAHSGVVLVATGGHHHWIGAIGGLAHFDKAHGRQAKNALDLQLELSPVQVPEAFAEALKIAALDFGHPALDRPDVVPVVEIELKQRDDQSDRGAEQENADAVAQTEAAAQTVDGAPYCPNPGDQRQ